MRSESSYCLSQEEEAITRSTDKAKTRISDEDDDDDDDEDDESHPLDFRVMSAMEHPAETSDSSMAASAEEGEGEDEEESVLESERMPTQQRPADVVANQGARSNDSNDDDGSVEQANGTILVRVANETTKATRGSGVGGVGERDNRMELCASDANVALQSGKIKTDHCDSEYSDLKKAEKENDCGAGVGCANDGVGDKVVSVASATFHPVVMARNSPHPVSEATLPPSPVVAGTNSTFDNSDSGLINRSTETCSYRNTPRVDESRQNVIPPIASSAIRATGEAFRSEPRNRGTHALVVTSSSRDAVVPTPLRDAQFFDRPTIATVTRDTSTGREHCHTEKKTSTQRTLFNEHDVDADADAVSSSSVLPGGVVSPADTMTALRAALPDTEISLDSDAGGVRFPGKSRGQAGGGDATLSTTAKECAAAAAPPKKPLPSAPSLEYAPEQEPTATSTSSMGSDPERTASASSDDDNDDNDGNHNNERVMDRDGDGSSSISTSSVSVSDLLGGSADTLERSVVPPVSVDDEVARVDADAELVSAAVPSVASQQRSSSTGETPLPPLPPSMAAIPPAPGHVYVVTAPAPFIQPLQQSSPVGLIPPHQPQVATMPMMHQQQQQQQQQHHHQLLAMHPPQVRGFQHALQLQPTPPQLPLAIHPGLPMQEPSPPNFLPISSTQKSFHSSSSAAAAVSSNAVPPVPVPGRRKIHFRLMEDVIPEREAHHPAAAAGSSSLLRRGGSTRKLFEKFRRKIRPYSTSEEAVAAAAAVAASSGVSALRGYGSSENLVQLRQQAEASASSSLVSSLAPLGGGGGGGGLIDRGILVVSWYDGTGTAELQEHVTNSVSRKLGLAGGRKKLEDVRIIDDAVEPHEEIVLSPYIPDGSRFMLRFRIDDDAEQQLPPRTPTPPPLPPTPPASYYHQRTLSAISRAPESPSAAPSPFPSTLNLEQLQALLQNASQSAQEKRDNRARVMANSSASVGVMPSVPHLQVRRSDTPPEEDGPLSDDAAETGNGAAGDSIDRVGRDDLDVGDNAETATVAPTEEKKKDEASMSADELVLERLNQLNDLLLDGSTKRIYRRREDKKQVVFVLANYFVLFLSLIAISAEIHERAPGWMEWLNSHLDSVQSCSADRDALYECVSQGNFSGLVAAFVFWVTRSAATKNILLFGFDTPQRLWTVVYEAGVTAMCWGTSYVFIRRGLNPDTRPNFLHKYWKDAVYGSLAGFNAAFMKAVLKNLIPQDQVLDVLESRQLRIVDWVSRIFVHRDN